MNSGIDSEMLTHANKGTPLGWVTGSTPDAPRRPAMRMVCKWCNSILFILSLSSCEVTHYHAQASTEKWVHEDSYTLGASNHTNRSDGSSRTYDGQKSFSDAMTAATTGLAAWGRVASVKSDNGL